MVNKSIAALVLLILATPAYGMVYTWTDSVGVAHYTNKQHEIPDRFRAKAKAIYPEQGDTAAQQQVAPSVPIVPPPSPVQQAKPEAPALAVQTSIIKKSRNILPDRETRKKRRNREETEE